MRILLAQPYALGAGHYDGYTKRMCEGFCQLGSDVTIITVAGTNSNWEKQMEIKHIEAGKKSSWFLVNLKAVQPKLKLFAKITRVLRFLYTSWLVEKRSLQIFTKEKYDILHFVDCEPITLSILFWFFGKPSNVFLTVRVPYSIYRKSFYRYTYDPLRRFAVRRLFKRINIITHSEPVKKSLLENKIVSGKEIKVIILGVDSVPRIYKKTDARKMLGLEAGKKIFGFFGNLIFHKGFDCALEAWSLLKNDFILLSLVHTDNISEEIRIREYIKNKNFDKRIIIKFGYASEQDMAINICACDAIILPYKKTFQGDSGIMSLACAYRVPLIVSDCGVIGEAVNRYNLGISFEPESVVSLKNAIESFAKTDENIINKIKQNMSSYTSAHGWKEFANQHLLYYQKIKNG